MLSFFWGMERFSRLRQEKVCMERGISVKKMWGQVIFFSVVLFCSCFLYVVISLFLFFLFFVFSFSSPSFSTFIHNSLALILGGSYGASRLLLSFVPRLIRLGVPESIIQMSLVQNPARILSWYRPPKPILESFAMWTCAHCKKRVPEGGSHSQFSRMEFLYCSVECLHKHRKGMKEFDAWVESNRRRRDDDDDRMGSRNGGRMGGSWSVKT